MSDFKLKVVLSLLSGVVFSLIFIILAFALPIKNNDIVVIKKPQGKLEQISHTLRK